MNIRLNLATNPLRNRRFFFFLSGLLAGITIILLLLAISLFVRYQVATSRTRSELIRIARAEEAARLEEKKYTAMGSAMARDLQAEVEQANRIIGEKSFPWSDFFSRLEKALPPACYLTSFSLPSADDFHLDLRLKLASPDLPTLLTAVEQFKTAGFTRIRVESEEQRDSLLISEVVMSYERSR